MSVTGCKNVCICGFSEENHRAASIIFLGFLLITVYVTLQKVVFHTLTKMSHTFTANGLIKIWSVVGSNMEKFQPYKFLGNNAIVLEFV